MLIEEDKILINHILDRYDFDKDIFPYFVSYSEKYKPKRIDTLFRYWQILNLTNLPGRMGDHDGHFTLSNPDGGKDIKVFVETKVDNGSNSFDEFKDSDQFKNDYQYLVDDINCRSVYVVFAMHKSTGLLIEPHGHDTGEMVIYGVYHKNDLNSEHGDWDNSYNGKTLKEFLYKLATKEDYVDKISLSALEFFYGQIERGTRTCKVFWIDENGNSFTKSGEFVSVNTLNNPEYKSNNGVIPMKSVKELYDELNKLCFNCVYAKRNRDFKFYICPKINGIVYDTRENDISDWEFTSEDFKDENAFTLKLVNVLNKTLQRKLKYRFTLI